MAKDQPHERRDARSRMRALRARAQGKIDEFWCEVDAIGDALASEPYSADVERRLSALERQGESFARAIENIMFAFAVAAGIDMEGS